MNYLVEFAHFMDENHSTITPERFPWEEKINALVQEVIDKSNELKDKFDWNGHRTQKFEFNIKARNWPNVETLHDEFGISEENLEQMWNDYLSDNLEGAGNDIVETSDFITDWYQGGRSGGWLFLETDIPSIVYPDSVIDDIVSQYKYVSEDITDEEYEQWKSLDLEDSDIKKGASLLTKFDLMNFETIDAAQEQSKETIESLKSELEILVKLEKELENVQDRIDSFWKNVDQWFREYVKDELDRD